MSAHKHARLKLHAEIERWPLKAPFRIAGHTTTELSVMVVTIEQRGCIGMGEAAGVYYLGDDVYSMLKQIDDSRPSIEAGINRESLQQLLPAGGARNAVDCALWDLEAKQKGRCAWQIAGLDAPKPLLTAYTIGAGAPEEMAAGARAFPAARFLKLKLTGEPVDVERVCAVRAVRPDVALAVDANQGFTREFLEAMLPVLARARVTLIEQPLKVGEEAQLDGLKHEILIAADESAQTRNDISALVGRFDAVNIKLDKCGGLTEALAMTREARRLGLTVMVGNMIGTALAMAPAFLLGQVCQVADLDGPLLLCADRSPGAIYENGDIWCPVSVWGGTERSRS